LNINKQFSEYLKANGQELLAKAIEYLSRRSTAYWVIFILVLTRTKSDKLTSCNDFLPFIGGCVFSAFIILIIWGVCSDLGDNTRDR